MIKLPGGLDSERLVRIVGVISALFALAGFGYNFANMARVEQQHDLRTYYIAADALQSHDDPYAPGIDQPVDGRTVTYRYLYMPTTLPLLTLLWYVDYPTMYVVMIVLKALAIIMLLYVWRQRILTDPWSKALLPLFMYLAFQRSMHADLDSGNVSMFEQLAVWIGIAFFIRKQYWAFAAAILCASLFKGLPIVFLGLVLLDANRKSLLAGSIGFLCAAALHVAAWVYFDQYVGTLVHNVGTISEPLSWNPTLFMVSRDVGESLAASGMTMGILFAKVGYVLIALTAMTVSVWTLRRTKNLSRLESVMIFLATFAVATPRLMTYSYFVLVPLALYVVNVVLRNIALKIALAVLICIHVFALQSLAAALVLYIVLIASLLTNSREHPSPLPIQSI